MGCSNSTSETYVTRHSVVGSGSGITQSPEEAIGECIQLLKGTPLFSTLSNEDLMALIEKAGNKAYKKGAKVAYQGEKGTKFFIILAGSAEVTTETENPATDIVVKKTLASLSRGDFFGEEAMALKCNYRPATVTATSALEVLVISKTLFEILGLCTKVDFSKAKVESDAMSNSTEAS